MQTWVYAWFVKQFNLRQDAIVIFNAVQLGVSQTYAGHEQAMHVGSRLLPAKMRTSLSRGHLSIDFGGHTARY